MGRFIRRLLVFTVVVVFLGVGAAVALVAFYPVPEPNDVALAESSEVFYADGTPVARLGDVARTSIPLSEVPLPARQAVMAAEDRDFYSHDGFSVTGIGRAVLNDASGGATQGGSTITQQYVKNAYLTHDQSVIRKARELILSVKLEFVTSKDAILEDYLNTIYFGRGAYGIEAASQAYFGHPASQLTLAEGAMLAGIIQAPSNYEPAEQPAAVQERLSYVVDGMVAKGWLTAADAATVQMPAFIPQDDSDRFGGQTGYIVEQARQELLAAGFTDAQIEGGGLRITTTIDPQAQAQIVQSVADTGPSTGTEGLRIGAASVDPATGAVLAMYGGPDYVASPLNNATQATAQAGSTFKAFALAAAFEADTSLYSRLQGNSPTTIAGHKWVNESNHSYGTVTLKQATEKSINTAFVDLEDQVGVTNVINAAYRAGLPEDTLGVNQDLTFVLGTASPTALDMASAYATFAARGMYHTPHILASVTTASGQSLYAADVRGKRVFETKIADQVNEALGYVISNGTATKARVIDRQVAGKTGTTDENKSAWFVGYGPQVATAVMMTKEDAAGNPVSLRGTGGISKVFGASFPLAIWTDYTQAYLEDKPEQDFVKPEGTQTAKPRWRGTYSPTPSPSLPEAVAPSQDVPTEPTETVTPEPTLAPVTATPAPTPTDPQTPTPPETPPAKP